jgi:hypothetical protein
MYSFICLVHGHQTTVSISVRLWVVLKQRFKWSALLQTRNVSLTFGLVGPKLISYWASGEAYLACMEKMRDFNRCKRSAQDNKTFWKWWRDSHNPIHKKKEKRKRLSESQLNIKIFCCQMKFFQQSKKNVLPSQSWLNGATKETAIENNTSRSHGTPGYQTKSK